MNSKTRLIVVVIIAGLMLTPTLASAVVVLSNAPFPDSPGWCVGLSGANTAGLAFSTPAGEAYALNSVSVRLHNWQSLNPSVTARVFNDAGGQYGTSLATIGTVTAGPGLYSSHTFSAATPIALQPSTTYWIVLSSNHANECAAGWSLASGAPTGIFTYGSTARYWSGNWVLNQEDVTIEIDADITQEVPVAVPVPGCDVLIDIPEQAVMGTFVDNALVYWMPGEATNPPLVIEVGKSYLVAGLDESGMYYQVLVSCEWVWVEVDKVGPTYDGVWGGQALPTEVIETSVAGGEGGSTVQ